MSILPENADAAVRMALVDLDTEIATSRRILELVPEEHLTWRPHEKSMTLGGLAQHIANLLYWAAGIASLPDYDVAGMTRLPQPQSRAEILELFERQLEGLKAAVAELDEAKLNEMWTLRYGEQVIFSMPRVAALRVSGINHFVHHRGQLTVYFRLLGAKVPGLYGPSADEQ